MEIFNIHLFELLLIAGLALVVFGPERLPEIGRMAGKQLARFLAWQQQFPELKVINEVRVEFEQEIASLRDELIRTRRQLDLSQEVNLNSLRDELRPMLSLRDQMKDAVSGSPTAPALRAPSAAGADPAPGAPPAASADPAPDAANADPAPDAANADPAPDAANADPAPGEAPPLPKDAPGDGEPASLREPSLDTAHDSAPETPGGPTGLAVRPPPAGTVPTSMRPNRLAATTPTAALSQPGGQPGADEGRTGPAEDDLNHDPAYPPSPNGQHLSAAAPSGDASGMSEADAQRLSVGAPTPAGDAAQAGAPGPAGDELRLALAQIERLSADMHALISALHERGLLGADWQPAPAISEQEILSR